MFTGIGTRRFQHYPPAFTWSCQKPSARAWHPGMEYPPCSLQLLSFTLSFWGSLQTHGRWYRKAQWTGYHSRGDQAKRTKAEGKFKFQKSCRDLFKKTTIKTANGAGEEKEERSGELGNTGIQERFLRKGSLVRHFLKGPERKSLEKLRDERIHGLENEQPQLRLQGWYLNPRSHGDLQGASSSVALK